ncbi:substrate-binding periplasmic protein [Solimonas flava]|uniref:substrate-binding periplasmic protein n=1 Tax=Solimonas flava TaxID=415849 RepID=UPI0003F75F3A|nr:ABC transporter substrate-binding protein [Solimonas flava]
MSTERRYRGFGALLTALLLMFAAPAMAGDRLDEIRERGELSVAVYRDFPPYSYAEGGRYVGVDVDLAQALSERLGVRLSLRPFYADENSDDDLRNQVWKGHYLGGGVADLMLHVGLDPEYVKRNDKAELFNVYQRETVGVIYRPGRFARFDSPLALAGHKVAVEVDSISDYYLSGAFNGRLRDSAVRKLNVGEAIDAWIKGEVDAVMAPRGQLEGALFRTGAEAPRFEISEFTGLFRTSWDVGMAIKAGNPQLKAALVDALAALRRDGRLQTIYAAYGLTQADAPLALAGH